MEDIVADPLKIHCIIWYQYIYHLDHGIEIPEKLLAWATRRTQQYLNHHADSAFILDTKTVSWKKYSRIHSLSDNWSVATQDKNKKKNPTSAAPTSTAISKPFQQEGVVPRANNILLPASSLHAPVPIFSRPQSSTHPPYASASSLSASEGTDLLLLSTSNVKVCDGTKRVTFCLKLTQEEFRLFRVPNTMKGSIYKFLNSMFGDDDGCLFDWSNKGTENLEQYRR
jgi:hypothetical protein